MNKRKSEGWLRFVFLVAVLAAFSVSALCSHLRKQAQVRVWSLNGIDAAMAEVDTVPEQFKGKRIGILTYIKRNRKRWMQQIKSNPLKWARLKEKLENIVASSKSSQLDENK